MSDDLISAAKPAIRPKDFFVGVGYPFRAFNLLRQTPRLWSYIVVPGFINLVVGIALYLSLVIPGWRAIGQLVSDLPVLLSQLATKTPEWLAGFILWLAGGTAAVDILLRVIFAGSLLLLTTFLLVQFGVVLGAPWYGKLSEEIELIQRGQLPSIEAGVLSVFRDVGRSLLFEVKKLLFALSLGLLVLLLGLIPGIGAFLVTAGGLALSTTLICLDFLDSTMERRRLSFRAKLGVIFRNLPTTAGFGLICLGLVNIPLLNLLTIPICVAAGTLLFCDQD